MQKDTQVIMLPTDKALEGVLVLKKHRLGSKTLSIIYRVEQQNTLKAWNRGGDLISQDNKLQIDQDWIEISLHHLYILSKEEIKEGDWYINQRLQLLGQAVVIPKEIEVDKCLKIIATTNPELWYGDRIVEERVTSEFLNIAKISQPFIDKYIEQYNKSNIITNTKVKYELSNGRIGAPLREQDAIYSPIIDKDGCIIINVQQESFSRKEVLLIAWKAHKNGVLGAAGSLRGLDGVEEPTEEFIEWFNCLLAI